MDTKEHPVVPSLNPVQALGGRVEVLDSITFPFSEEVTLHVRGYGEQSETDNIPATLSGMTLLVYQSMTDSLEVLLHADDPKDFDYISVGVDLHGECEGASKETLDQQKNNRDAVASWTIKSKKAAGRPTTELNFIAKAGMPTLERAKDAQGPPDAIPEWRQLENRVRAFLTDQVYLGLLGKATPEQKATSTAIRHILNNCQPSEAAEAIMSKGKTSPQDVEEAQKKAKAESQSADERERKPAGVSENL